ncbi:membrane-anchored junction protein [Rhincodon typus]|uniref:membrane-anchored junction protein n=1 Tax=Rhincodon typus TaxID=259920 RepID=UPI00202DF968|nr:membrane-anchored junction protein [Rhincodon typus]
MPLKAFTYPLPETRFVHAGRTVYKLKMRYSHHVRCAKPSCTISLSIRFSREDMGIDREQVRQELEDAIRAVLGNLDRLQPFTTEHFTIFPYKNEWERLSELQFKQGDKVLISYPYVCTLYIELRSDQQHSAAAGECPFIDCHLLEKLTEKTAALPVTKEANEQKPEKLPLQLNRKRSENALMKIINKENMVDSGTMSEKKRKKRAKTSTQAKGQLIKQPSSCRSGKPEMAAHSRNDDGVMEQTISAQKLGCDTPQAAAGGMIRFLFSALFPFHLIFGRRQSK